MDDAAITERTLALAAETGRPTPFRIDGQEVVIQVEGSGPAVLLCAPLGAELDYWDDLADQLTGYATVIRYDRRAGDGPYPGTRDVEDLAALVRSLDRSEPVVLVGASIGGLIARVAAREVLDRLAALVLVDGSCEDFAADPAVPAVFRQRTQAEQDGAGMDRRPLDEAARAAGYLAPLEDLPVWLLCAGKKTWGTLAAEDPEAASVMDRRWLIHQRRQLGLSTNTQLTLVTDGDHHLAVESPGLVVEVIRRMLPWRQVRPGYPDKWVDPRAVDAVAEWCATALAQPGPAALDAPAVTVEELKDGVGAAAGMVDRLRREQTPNPEKIREFAGALRAEIVRLFRAGLQRGEGGLAPDYARGPGFSINIDNSRADPVLTAALKTAGLPAIVLPMNLQIEVAPTFVAVYRAGKWTTIWDHPTLPRPQCEHIEKRDVGDGRMLYRCGLKVLHNDSHDQWQPHDQSAAV